jgi:hypothetical protein
MGSLLKYTTRVKIPGKAFGSSPHHNVQNGREPHNQLMLSSVSDVKRPERGAELSPA